MSISEKNAPAKLVWVRLAGFSDETQIPAQLTSCQAFMLCTSKQELFNAIQKYRVFVTVFDFIFPTGQQLEVVRQVKQNFQSIPLIMLTSKHSMSLVIWAMRNRVWDLLMKPYAEEDIVNRIDTLAYLKEQEHAQAFGARNVVFPSPLQATRVEKNKSKVQNAVSYIHEHYQVKISLEEVARTVAISPFQLSRMFRREMGITFQEYIVQHRVDHAKRLLQSDRHNVTDVAYAVGFNDLSYFSRMFKRLEGRTPSEYKREQQKALPITATG